MSAIQKMKRHPEVRLVLPIWVFLLTFLQSRYILTSMALSASVFCNLSITQFYTTLFPYARFRTICRILQTFTVSYYITFLIVQFFSCPQKKTNALAMAEACAKNSRTIWVGASAVALVLDLANVVLPMPILWRLNIDFRKKVKLTLLFGLGFL